MDSAYFVKHPRTIQDLQVLHLQNRERPFEIIKEIVLNSIDYENFTMDMVADREFLENSFSLCSVGNPMKCLFVREHTGHHGILVVPDPKSPAYVLWAAIFTMSKCCTTPYFEED